MAGASVGGRRAGPPSRAVLGPNRDGHLCTAAGPVRLAGTKGVRPTRSTGPVRTPAG
jgi:hypothetical protein